MLETIKSEAANRITELRSLFIHFSDLQKTASTSVPVVPITVNTIKGLFFVQLYAVYEFTVTSLTQNSLSYINAQNMLTNSYKLQMLSIVLDSHFNSIEASNGKKHWDRRKTLLNDFDAKDVIPIDITILPTGEGNLKHRQLKSIFDTMCLTCDAVPTNRFIGRLEELVENRNAISHGRLTPSEIGSRYSIADLEQILNEISELCSYLIKSFEDYLLNEQYKLKMSK